MKQNKAIAMPFNWLFAIVVGALILFLAIYGVSKFIGTSEKLLYTESAAQIISLLDPFETGLGSGKSASINFQKETQLFLDCSEYDNRPFGKQTIAFSEKTLGDKFGDMGVPVSIKNKYVFAEENLEGKTAYVFSKSFNMPFKVADLIVISSGEYCFYQTPDKIEKEFKSLGTKNIIFAKDLKNCSGKTVVCWTGNCDIKVSENKVIKENKELYYSGDLVYAAIFSSPEIYECNIIRLKNKFNELALIYQNKASIMQNYGCGTEMSVNLENVITRKVSSSKDILGWQMDANSLDLMNPKGGCELY